MKQILLFSAVQVVTILWYGYIGWQIVFAPVSVLHNEAFKCHLIKEFWGYKEFSPSECMNIFVSSCYDE
jgi:hypothetical protein